MRGEGTLYLRGGVYWAQVWLDGKRVRESLETSDLDQARKNLQKLRKMRERGSYLAPSERRIALEELLDDLLVDLKLRGKASVRSSQYHLQAVREELGPIRASTLDTATIRRFQETRLEAGRKPATVNRECELIRQAYKLAARSTPPKARAVPHIPHLTEDNARQGFLSPADLPALWKALQKEDEDVADFMEWFAWTGMRPAEIRRIEWLMVDRDARTLDLDPKIAKTRKGRVIPLDGPLWAIIQRRWAKRRLDTSLVFHRVSRGKPGHSIDHNYMIPWRRALVTAKLPRTLLPYDLRRTAVRNMIRAGVDKTVAKKISGHLTDSTFERYNITDEKDVRDAMVRTVLYVKRKR
jgi:integrase